MTRNAGKSDGNFLETAPLLKIVTLFFVDLSRLQFALCWFVWDIDFQKCHDIILIWNIFSF